MRSVMAFCIFTFLASTSSYATTSVDVFKKYPNHYFIETGSFQGDGIQKALKAGFPNIHSIELARPYYLLCKNRFKNHPNVKIWLGDSTDVLPLVLKEIKVPATFWLDGHYSFGVNSGKGKKIAPF